MQYLVTHEDLERRALGAGVSAALFNGGEHGLTSVSIMFGEVQPGDSVRLHRHTYEEVFVVQEGQGAFTIDGTTVEARAGDIVIIPAGLPHRFVNVGAGPMRQTAIHASHAIAIEWLEKRPPQSGDGLPISNILPPYSRQAEMPTSAACRQAS